MTLEEGINVYVLRKQETGMSFSTGHRIFRSFLKTVGNLSLRQIKVDHVSQFLNSGQTSAKAFRRKHSLLRRFFNYWAAHSEIAGHPMPANRPAQRSIFLPYIYTQEELRHLLRSAPRAQTRSDLIHHKTLRTALLMLYATGATVSEIARLTRRDVDLQSSRITFSGSQLKAGRSIPIGRDLIRVARRYGGWRKRIGAPGDYFFSKIDGGKISPTALRRNFERLRRTAGIAGYRESSQRPCLRDFRATFAVHRITAWIKKKEDLNLMLPALAAYMGNVGLDSTERYLRLTPQRFQNALNNLSPPTSRSRWRDDPTLLEFLTAL